MNILRLLSRFAVTLVIVAGAAFAGWWLWDYYMNEPWTRDGRVRTDVVQVASDVEGLVTEVRVVDNQAVRRGEVLFAVDPARYRLLVEQAEADLESARAELLFRQADTVRYAHLGDNVVSVAQRQEVQAATSKAEAAAKQAEAALDLARFNLERTEVKATVDGFVTNLQLKAGNYVSVGQAVIAVVDRSAFHVVGYFEETKLSRIRVGDPVRVTIMGTRGYIRGHVDSIAQGIVDRDRIEGTGLLPNINPSFNWVRLAQRVPVRIALDEVPDAHVLVAGRTATVEVVAGDREGERRRGEPTGAVRP